MKTRHIEIIREQLGVALTTIYHYNNDHKGEIEHIRDIFYLKGASKEKVLALLYMLSSGKEDDAIQKYREQTGLNNIEYNPTSLLDQYKVLLITAMVYNRAFYAMAVNYRGFVSAGLAVGKVEEEAVGTVPMKNTGWVYLTIVKLESKKEKYRYISYEPVYRKAAAGVGFTKVFEKPFDHKGISGTLRFWGNEEHEVYVDFVFDEFQELIPYKLELCFTTTRDHKQHPPIIIPADENRITKDQERGVTIITSKYIGDVDYSDGIDSNYTLDVIELQ